MMRNLLLVIFLILFPTFLLSQEYDLSGMQGLKDKNGDVRLELSGYDILITTMKGQAGDEKVIGSIKKKYDMGTILAEYSEAGIPKANKIIEAESKLKDRPKVKLNQVCYILEKSEKEAEIVLFQTLNQRDIILEQEVIRTYLKNGLKYYILDEPTAGSISFAGREINLGTACKWMSPHNINCNGGQMSWAEFPSFESANLDINARIDANANDNVTILSENDIDVIFEGIPSLAHRVVYKQKAGFGQRTQPLIVYYIVQEVRDRYISCVLSNYGYNRNDYELAPLLQEVMSIPELPDMGYNQRDIFQNQDELQAENDEKAYDINLVEIRAGSWFALGNLSNAYKAAPSIGAYLGFPIKRVMAVDVGFMAAFPVDRQLFDYYYRKEPYATKADVLVNINARFRYQQEAARNVYWTIYTGAGVSSVQTDLEKEYYDDDESKWRTFETLDVFGGVNLRYKKVGLYLEYHYSPYSLGGRVRAAYGNSAVNLGIAVCL